MHPCVCVLINSLIFSIGQKNSCALVITDGSLIVLTVVIYIYIFKASMNK